MKIRYLYILTISIILSIGLNSCFKEDVVLTEESLTYNRPLNLALPVLNTRFSSQEMLDILKGDEDALIKTDENGLLYIDFEVPFTYAWDDVVGFGDIFLSKSYTLPVGLKSIAPVQIVDSIPLASLGQRFDESTFKSGNLDISISAAQDLSADYVLTFTSLIAENGDSIRFNGNLNAPMNDSYDLSGSKAVFVHNQDKSVSSIAFRIDIDDPQVDGPNPSSQIEIDLSITDLVPEVLTGYFGTVYPLNQEFELNFSFFEAFNIADIVQFKGSYIQININNYFGLPIDLQFKDMFMIKSQTGEAFELEFLGNNTIPLEGAELADPVVPKQKSERIDSTNSNIEEAINFFPDRIKFDVIAKTNPQGEIPGEINFIKETNEFEGTLGLFFPFWLKTQAYNRLDTMGFDFEATFGSDDGSFSPLDVIEFMEMQFKTRNAMPFDLSYQVYPMNNSNTIIDSLFDEPQNLLQSAITDAQGKVDTANIVPHIFKLILDKEQIEAYTEAKVKYFLLKSFVSTENNGEKYVQMHDFNFIEMKFMFEVKSTNN